MTLDEANAALARGRHLVLVTPPDPEQAAAVWELLPALLRGEDPGAGPAVLIICADAGAAAEWASALSPARRVHAVTGLVRSTRLVASGRVAVLAGSAPDLNALVQRSALRLNALRAVVVAWPETIVGTAAAATLDSLLGEAHEAPRLVLSWNPALLSDFLERHARRALVIGPSPVDQEGRPLAPVGPAAFAVVPAARRTVALQDTLDVLGSQEPFIWSGESSERFPAACDAVLCRRLPTREQFTALGALGRPVIFVTTAQLPYLRSIAAPLTPLRLPAAPDRARDRTDELRARIVRLLEAGAVDAELALLDPLFDRFDPAEVAAALLALSQRSAGGQPEPPPSEPPPPGWVKVFVNVGKRDRAQPKDLVGALIREVGLAKNDIGRIDLREAFSIVEVAPHAADRAVRGLSGVAIKGRRAQAKLERGRAPPLST